MLRLEGNNNQRLNKALFIDEGIEVFFFCQGIESKFDEIDVNIDVKPLNLSIRFVNVFKYWFLWQLNLYF